MAEKKNELTFYDSLHNSLVAEKEALPKDFNIERFTNNALALLNNNQQLIDYSKKHGTAQIKAGLIKGAYLGLDFMNNECYLVPYGNSLNFMTDYRGAKKLAKKYSVRPIKDIYAKLVREGDEFEEEIINSQPQVNFKPKPFNNGKVIGAFAVCLFEDGGVQYETMSLDELENTRKHSKASNSPAWKDFTGEMYKKTVLRRLCKNIEIDFDNANQIQAFNEDGAIETDVKAQAANDIQANANKANLDDEVVVEVSPDEIEGQMSMDFADRK